MLQFANLIRKVELCSTSLTHFNLCKHVYSSISMFKKGFLVFKHIFSTHTVGLKEYNGS